MDEEKMTRLSRFLSLILRHKPEEIGIALDENGWADVEELLAGMNRRGRSVDRDMLEKIVMADEKGRYIFSEDGKFIRACQGHSINVDMQFEPIAPPEFLYHGTASRFLEQIEFEGLKSRSRQYVHLSPDRETAVQVGARHGKPVIFVVLAREMTDAGLLFYRSDNGVWLTKSVPAQFLRKEEE